MAFGTLTARGTGNAKASNSFHSGDTASDIPANSLVIVVVASNNDTTTDNSDNSEVASVSVGALLLTKGREVTRSSGSAADGCMTSVWWGVTASAIAATSSISVNYNNARAARTYVCLSSSTAGGGVEVAGTAALAEVSASGSDVPSTTTSGLSSEEHLHVKGCAAEGTAGTLTATSGWTAYTGIATSGGSATTNIWNIGEWVIVTDTGATSDPTSNKGNNTDWATCQVSFREVVATLYPASAPDIYDPALARAVLRSRGH